MDATDFFTLEAELSAHVSERLLDLVGVERGSRVLDLGCGFGEPALRAAERVGPEGYVLGIDLNDQPVALARAHASSRGLQAIVELRTQDAAALDETPASFDCVTSRWGLSYMNEPERALTAARRATKTGGALGLALWIDPERSDWWRVPRAVTERFVSLPPPLLDGPSPFRFGHAERLDAVLQAAGWARTHSEDVETSVVTALDGAGIVSWTTTILTRLAAMVPEAARAHWARELAAEADRFRGVDGQHALGGTTRLVVARAVP